MKTDKEAIVLAEQLDIGAMLFKEKLGPIREFFDDSTVVEIMLNPDKHIWIEKLGQQPYDTGIIVEPKDSESIIKIVATYCRTVVSREKPIISAELPNFGSRFEGIIPPVTENPTFSIRQPATMILTLDDYIRQRVMTPVQVEKIRECVKAKKNILFVGGTGSGKTTATNAVLDEIGKTGDRIVILEDTKELQCSAPNNVFMRTMDGITMTDLLKSTMRLRPDRIVVGEVRDGAALALLKAWNTGHPGGIATVHANSAYGGLLRLEQLIQEVLTVPQSTLIGEAVDLIIYIERSRDEVGRKVKEMALLHNYENGKYQLEYIQ